MRPADTHRLPLVAVLLAGVVYACATKSADDGLEPALTPTPASPTGDQDASSTPTGTDVIGDTTSPTTAVDDGTCLGKAGFGFAKKACYECMNADVCCQATIACFKDDAECTALQDCVAACATPGDGGVPTDGGKADGGGGKGDGGGGGGGSPDGGVKACQDTCKAQHATGVAKWQAYTTCVSTTCAASCL